MNRHWAIVIGINHYQFRQPLACAQQDAQALYEWLTQPTGRATAQCLLATDTSPKFQARSTYPTAEALKSWIDWLGKEGIQAGDQLWVFFSGYGECWQGQDYLLPIDAEEQFSPRTWLSVRSLLSSLKTLPTSQILLLLDMNRSQSARSDDRVGRQTMTLAKELGIATICSCQPEQFSHESTALGQGFFTAALLEGLRIHAGQPLGVLVKFLQRRLPELSEHSYRPRQDPMIMVAPQQLEQYLLPQIATASTATSPTVTSSTVTQPIASPSFAVPPTVIPSTVTPSTVTPSTVTQPIAAPDAATPASPPAPPAVGEKPMPVLDLTIDPMFGLDPTFETVPPTAPEIPAITLDEVSSLESSAPVIDQAADRQHPARGQRPARTQSKNQSRQPRDSQGRDSQGREPEELSTREFVWQVLLLSGAIAIVLSLASILRNLNPTASTDPNNSPTPASTTNPIAKSPTTPLTNRPPTAQSTAQPATMPTTMPTVPSPDPSPRLDVPQSPPADSAKILEDARSLIRPTSASELQQAIERASQIPPGDGRYAETQRQIDHWCREMLTLANQRAQSSKFREAITAAEMIPRNRCPQIAASAEKSIGPWRQRIR